MDIHRDRQNDIANTDFSAGNAYVEWNTGTGVERVEFPIIATAATVQTALRGITGWSGVTVTSRCKGAACTSTTLGGAHSYKVEFPSGYDDGGQTPNVGLVPGFGGDSGTASDGVAIIYDQRFSNSLWLGDITGYQLVDCTKTNDDANDYCNIGTADSDTTMQLDVGDNVIMSIVQMGHEDATNGFTATEIGTGGTKTKYNSLTNLAVSTADIGLANGFLGANWPTTGTKEAYVKIDHSKDLPTQTSLNTEHYFAVGSEIEVLATTWDNADIDADSTSTVPNQYRSFRVLSHVKNTFGHKFAKLDSTPTTDSSTNYALKVTTHNSTITKRKNIDVNGVQNEIQQILALQGTTAKIDDDDTFRIYINAQKGNVEFTEVLNSASSVGEIAEAINAFTALSGPVTVTKDVATVAEWQVTFAAIDGDVPELSVVSVVDVTTGGTNAANTYEVNTLVEGWSFFAGSLARLENVQPGSVINITSKEVVKFTITSWTAGSVVFAYDGTVASAGLAFASPAITEAQVVAAISSIKDEKGATKITVTADSPTTSIITVTMPEGADGSKLELLKADATLTGIKKSVSRNNNGRSFKVVRVEQQEFPLGDPAGTQASTTLQYAAHNTAALDVGDEITISRTAPAAACEYLENPLAGTVGSLVNAESRLISGVVYADAPTVVYTVAAFPTVTTVGDTGCTFSAYRTVLVVDSMPDAMSAASAGVDIEMDIYGPKGTCSVSETVKGTYESDVCSSRGSCDSASGLCTCHEGYSGEACETQTVLV